MLNSPNTAEKLGSKIFKVVFIGMGKINQFYHLVFSLPTDIMMRLWFCYLIKVNFSITLSFLLKLFKNEDVCVNYNRGRGRWRPYQGSSWTGSGLPEWEIVKSVLISLWIILDFSVNCFYLSVKVFGFLYQSSSWTDSGLPEWDIVKRWFVYPCSDSFLSVFLLVFLFSFK